MSSSSRSLILQLIKPILSIVGLFWIVDAYFQARFSDFWSSPDAIETKLGVFSYELLLLTASMLLLSLPALLVAKYFSYRLARFLVFIGMMAVSLVLLLGWSFYGLFEKFIGVFALQMIVQDGGQLLEFVAKMPSSFDYRISIECAVFLALITYVFWSESGRMRRVQMFLSIAAIGVLIPGILMSVFWNKPIVVAATQETGSSEIFNRINLASYTELYAKVGPLSALYDSVAEYAYEDELAGAVDAELLDKRHTVDTELTTSGADFDKYNIVYILVESLHPDMLSAFRDRDDVMPTVNELSENAYVLTNAWAQASHSNYADVAALSGQYPLRSSKIHFYPKNPGYPKSLPYDMLHPLGYKVGLFSSQNENWGLMSNYLDSESVDIFSHVGGTFSNGSGKPNLSVKVNDQGVKSLSYTNFMYRGDSGGIERLDEITVKAASDWLGSLNKSDPVFMYFNLQASHSPFNALPDNYERVFLTDQNSITKQIKDGKIAAMPKSYVIQAYEDSLHYVDQNIAEVVDHMKLTGRHENTIYIISADTSYDFNGRILGNGGALNAEVLRIPVIIAVPGMSERVVVDAPAEQIDIMPTILDIVGVGPHPSSQGVNIVEYQDPERVVFAVAQTPVAHQYSAVFKNWQMLYDKDSDTHTLNYVGKDPDAARGNLLAEDEVEWLVLELKSWRNRQLAYYSSPSIYSQYNPPKVPIRLRSLQTASEDLD